eukprot:1956604-Lingulodinium_polyedra.AAC.1
MSLEVVRRIWLLSIGALAKDPVPEKRMVVDQFCSFYQTNYRRLGSILRHWDGEEDWNFELGFYSLI